MLRALTILLLYQLVGEIIGRSLGLPIPGPVLGMLLLFITLLIRGEAPLKLRQTSRTLLSHLALLFVPAGVGVMTHLALLRDEWLPIVVTLIVATYVTLVATALTMKLLLRLTGPRTDQGGNQYG